MARVVHRRKSPPYALIVFAFLFLVSSALAVLTFNKLDKERLERKKKDALLTAIAGDANAGGMGDVGQQLLKQRTDGDLKRPVVVELVEREKAMRRIITTRAESTAKAEELVTILRKDQGALITNKPLVAVIESLIEKVGSLEGRNKELEGTITTKDTQNKQFKAQAESLTTELAAAKEKGQKDVQAVEAQYGTYQSEMDKKLAEAQRRWEEDRTRQDDQLTKNTDTIAQQTKRIRELTLERDNLREIMKPKPEAREVPSLAMKADGKVLRVLAGEDVCYIDLGRDDRVMPGLTLAVFAPGKGPKTKDAAKGKLIVTSVEGSLSECRVESVLDRRDPITIGDSVFNLVFSPSKTFTFVIEGKFDLDGGLRPSELGTAQVKDLIKKYGGKVGRVDVLGPDPKDTTRLLVDLDPEADFVVMGAEPSPPTKPQDGAPEQVLAAYKEDDRVYKRYSAIRRAAASIGVPVLNTNRFLSLVGYTPKPPLR